MRDLPPNFSVVSDSEFQSLQYLPDFELRGECLCRVNDAEERFIWPQSLYDRWRRITEQVESEAMAAGDTELVEVIDPIATIPAPVDSIPDADKQASYKLGLGEHQPLPEHGESSRRPSWFREPLDPFGGR